MSRTDDVKTANRPDNLTRYLRFSLIITPGSKSLEDPTASLCGQNIIMPAIKALF